MMEKQQDEAPTTALARVDGDRIAMRAFEPSNLEEAYRLAKIFVAGRLLPRALSTPEAAFTVIAAGRELGLTAMQSIRSIHVIEGKPVLSADLMCALVKRHPDCEYFCIIEMTPEYCIVETQRRGEEPTRVSWTIEEAQCAGLVGKDNWKKYPKAMLRARAVSDLCRAVYPDAFMGVYDPDDLDHVPPPARGSSPRPVIDLAPDVPNAAPAHDPQTGELAATPPTPSVRLAEISEEEADRLLAISTEYLDAFRGADSMDSLLDVGKRLKASKLPEPYSKPLREAYGKRKKELEAAAKGAA